MTDTEILDWLQKSINASHTTPRYRRELPYDLVLGTVHATIDPRQPIDLRMLLIDAIEREAAERVDRSLMRK